MAGDEDDTANPGGMFAKEGDAQNGKSTDWIEGAGMGGTPAEQEALRRGKAGRGMVDSDGPIKGSTDTPSQ